MRRDNILLSVRRFDGSDADRSSRRSRVNNLFYWMLALTVIGIGALGFSVHLVEGSLRIIFKLLACLLLLGVIVCMAWEMVRNRDNASR